MNRFPIWVLLLLFFSLLHLANSVDVDTRSILANFFGALSSNNGVSTPISGWNLTSDPCKDRWTGIFCDSKNTAVRKIYLDKMNLAGPLNVSICYVPSLAASLSVLSLINNNISGEIPEEIANCMHLTRLYLSGNQLSGKLPQSLARLNNLKGIGISDNKFTGELPDLARITGMEMFLAENNQLSGKIPNFEFSNFLLFNVSFNNFSGSIPRNGGKFSVSSFMGNPGLCGPPLPNKCPKKGPSTDDILMYSGYFILGLAFLLFVIVKIMKRKREEKEKIERVNKVAAVDISDNKLGPSSAEYKSGVSRSEISMTSVDADSAMVSTSLIVLTSPVINGLKFDDLLKAPAELLGRGKHGSLYKVICDNGMVLAVKRIKDWTISINEFKLRMQRLDQVKHPNVLPAIAFYCSRKEKLLVYEYLQNGSLFRLLHGTHMGVRFEWTSRLNIAATIAEALAFMHQELQEDGIAHGNLKSSNVLLNKNLEACITEYGLMADEESQSIPNNITGPESKANVMNPFKEDIYRLGVILLQLLTGKLVQNNEFDLAKWVHSVISEEWTVEVFDRSLVQEGASEERMLHLLQIAIKCTKSKPEERPSINQVAVMINSIKEDEERSVVLES
ncbi:Protein kinase domain [Dillenia turbinata]|uniref:Protein kinase domain n=1 Tax=Dillenia turbinata TaxID=194707 RepID=A0AAN8YU69_9MAGN